MGDPQEQFTELWHAEAPHVLAFASRHVGPEAAHDAEVTYVAVAPTPAGSALPAPEGANERETDASGPSASEGGDRAPVPAGADACSTIVDLRETDDDVTFTLAAESVRSDAVLHITTMSSDDGRWTGLAVGWEGGPC